jgi:hypothetical protein
MLHLHVINSVTKASSPPTPGGKLHALNEHYFRKQASINIYNNTNTIVIEQSEFCVTHQRIHITSGNIQKPTQTNFQHKNQQIKKINQERIRNYYSPTKEQHKPTRKGD